MTQDRTVTSSLMTVPEVAALLRVNKATVYALIQRGELPVIRVGTSFRIDPADLDRMCHPEGMVTRG